MLGVAVTPASVRSTGGNRTQQYDELERLSDKFDDQINFALALNMKMQPRIKRSGEGEIKIQTEKQFDNEAKDYALFIANSWGWNDNKWSYKEKQRIARERQ
jgi:hypothetical protein